MKPAASPTAPTTPLAPSVDRGLDRVIPKQIEHEQLAVRHGPRSGATMAVAVHSTALGAGLGGARLWTYDSDAEAIADALRLAKAMTYKAAAAGLDLGGAKGVISRPEGALTAAMRQALMHDFGDLVDSLEGRYITAEDVGTGPEDMVTISERTDHVVGRPRGGGGSGDPSPVTAAGVQAAIRGCCSYLWGSPELSGRLVTVIGLGHVGEPLARGLAAAGAELALSDVDERRRALAAELGARWIEPALAAVSECDVLAPCALGGTITAENVDRLGCRIICGAANNVLADESLAERLATRDIVYGPDFIANAGGLMSVYGELTGYGADQARRLADGIEATMLAILNGAERQRTTPLEAARELADARLTRARRSNGKAARVRGSGSRLSVSRV